jgi:hypothetical protein
MTETGVLRIPSLQTHCSPEEWQARVDLAACYRLVELHGMADMMANHISSRVPGEEGAFLINPYGMMYEEITASCLIKVDLAGDILSKPDFGALGYGINTITDCRDVMQQRGAATGARGDLEQLPARHASSLWPHGMAGAAAQAGPPGPELPHLIHPCKET